MAKKVKHKKLWEKFYHNTKSKVEVVNYSVYENLYYSTKEYLNKACFDYLKKKMTFQGLLNNIEHCAKALKYSGINAGDVVSICMANTPEAVIAFYAINKIGAIANLIHPLSAEEEIKDSLIATNSELIIAIDIVHPKIKNIIDKTPTYKTVIVTPNNSMPFVIGASYYITKGRKNLPSKNEAVIFWNDWISQAKDFETTTLVKTTKEQPAAILQSGGTSGTPKNIILTNGNINVVVEQVKIQFPDLDYKDNMLGVLPIFHCFGLVVGIHVPLCVGAKVTLVPQFDASKFHRLILLYRPTLIIGVPTLYEALMNNKKMKHIDLSCLKYVVSGGDSMTADKQERVNKFLAEHKCKARLIQGYGMTETSGPVTFGGLGSDIPGSVGIPMPSIDMKIVDKTTKEELPPREIGEIMISGPNVMLGYLDNEEETNNTLELDNKKRLWTHTGDMGYINEDGVLFFVQRLKRMLIVSGYNVYPSHIEEVIMKHDAVLNCGVVGIPHPYKVQVPKAYIVLKNGINVDHKIKKDIKEYCSKNLAHYMIPKEFEFRESLPKTKLGKVNYRELEKN